MSEKAPAAGARRRGTSKHRAVAGAAHVRGATSASVSSIAKPPVRGEERLWGRARRAGQQRRRRAADSEWSMIIELPETVPVLPAELSVLEAHLSASIDVILAGRY
jgi:hypothetical protein